VREVLGIPVVSREVLSQRTNDYQGWVRACARNDNYAHRDFPRRGRAGADARGRATELGPGEPARSRFKRV
jgi:hypothetical protein